MKKLIIILMLVLFTSTTKGQEVIQLEEAVVIAPHIQQVLEGETSFSYTVMEQSNSEFENDPIAFLKANFDIEEFVKLIDQKEYDSYEISFRSSGGVLKAYYDNDGTLRKNKQYFKDVELPMEIKQVLLRDHEGWVVDKTKFFSRGKGESTEKVVYRIKLSKGDKTKRVKLVPDLQENVVVVKN